MYFKNTIICTCFSNCNYFKAVLKLVGEFEFLPNHEIITKFGNLVCGNKFRTQPLCSNFIFLVAGFNEEQLEPDIIPVVMGHIPAGASTKQLIHYGQEINSGIIILCQVYFVLFNFNVYYSNT